MTKCEVYSRVTGYCRPINQWNNGKRSEWNDRQAYSEQNSLASEFGKDV
jgi:ribonucleoside-triphosphate reductase